MANDNEVILEVKPKSDVEPFKGWGDLCGDANAFITLLAARLYVSFSGDLGNFVRSDKVPPASERNKVWIKTSFPYGIGTLIEGGYKMDYGLSGYPVNTPFLALPANMLPLKSGVSEISESQINAYGLPLIRDSATTPMKWYIFNPPEIVF